MQITGAQAAVSQPAASTPVLSATVASSWQTSNTVWAIAPVHGMVFVGGSFKSVRPPGAPEGTNEVTRTYLAEFNGSTGALATSFAPVLDGQVTALAVSPDGSTLYAGGSFTHVGSAYRDHLAAFSTATGALSATWKPQAGSPVLALAPSPNGSKVYVGGDFSVLDGAARTYAGEVSSATGALQSWAPPVSGVVTSLAVAPNQSRVLVGGYFTKFNGTAQQGVVDVDANAGKTNNLKSIEPNYPGCSATVKDIIIGSVSAQNPAGVAYIASEGTGGGCFDGDWAANVATGALVWQNDCLGATQSLVIIQNVLYKGSHAHDCAFEPGGFPQVTTDDHHLLAQSLVTGTLGHWNPNTNMGNSSTGTVNGGLGPRVMATDGTRMFLGGDFTTVNGRPQQGFTIFPYGPDTTPPGVPGAPTVTSTQAGIDTVTFSAVSDPDVGTLTYDIYRGGAAAPIGTVTATSWPWALPVLHFQDTGRRPGSQHRYWVRASNGTTSSAKSLGSALVTVSGANPPRSYQRAVLRNGPSFYWPLSQQSGRTATDLSPHHFNGVYQSGTSRSGAGPITGGKATATNFDGRTGLVFSPNAVQAPTAFSIEVWFRATTNEGGMLVGFGNRRTRPSTLYDRHLYMMNDGQLVFGVYTTSLQTIESSNVYNDGRWHSAVATLGPSGMTLYVDGRLIGTNLTNTARAYHGYWRVGGDNLRGWNLDPRRGNSQGLTEPGSYYFQGTMADVAVYPNALTAHEIAMHYAASEVRN